MPAYYTYLISSLPMLRFGARPPFSFERFLEICKGLIPDGEMDILKEISAADGRVYAGAEEPTLKRWRSFDTALRNELAKIRASRKRRDPSKYIRRDGYAEASITHIAMSACRNPFILEAERALDTERWRFLGELEAGHYFDIGFLVVYACKLLILQKWDKVAAAGKARLLEEALA